MEKSVDIAMTSFYINRCRVCLEKTDKFYPLVGAIANVETTISHMIACCTSMEVEISDDLPNGVCVPCFRIIRIAYNFINQYKETFKVLSEHRIKVENAYLETETSTHSNISKQENIVEKTKNIMAVKPAIQLLVSDYEEMDQNIEEDEMEEQVSEHDEEEQEVVKYDEEQDITENEDYEDVDDIVSDQEYKNLQKVQQSEESNNAYNFNTDCFDNSKDSESVEHILIVTDNENNKHENLETIVIPEQKPRYTLRTKIVSQLKCPRCLCEFTGYDKKYKDHMTEFHSKEMFDCNLCSRKNLTVKEFLHHFEEIHRYQCPICCKSFLKNSLRALHMKKHNNIICKQSNLKPLVLENEDNNLNDVHINQQNSEEGILKECSEEQMCYNYRRRLVTRYRCPKCPHVGPYLNYEKGFVNHILFQHNHELFNCNLCSTNNLDVDEFLKHFGDIHRYQCPICNKSFNRISTKQVHMKTHSDIRYDCTYCEKSFYTPWFLKKHMNRHTETVKYTCDDCGYSSATYDNFRYHMKKHQGPKHLCTYCGQSFLLAVHLKYHMWKHTGDKYFKCDQCTKSYTSGSQLKKHKRRHH